MAGSSIAAKKDECGGQHLQSGSSEKTGSSSLPKQRQSVVMQYVGVVVAILANHCQRSGHDMLVGGEDNDLPFVCLSSKGS